MDNLVTIAISVVSGLFSILAVTIAWNLKKKSEYEFQQLNEKKERYSEIKELYISTFELFENAAKEMKKFEGKNYSEEFSKLSANIHLIGSEEVSERYTFACQAFENWAHLYLKATPNRTKIGDDIVTFLQAPDPTLEYKEKEKEAYGVFSRAYNSLVTQMKAELKNA